MGSREHSKDRVRSRSSSRSNFHDSERPRSKSKDNLNPKRVTICIPDDPQSEHYNERGTKTPSDPHSRELTDINNNELRSRRSRAVSDSASADRKAKVNSSISTDKRPAKPTKEPEPTERSSRSRTSRRDAKPPKNPFEVESRSCSREDRNGNPFLDSQSPNAPRSKSRSKERESRTRSEESRTKSMPAPTVEPETVPESLCNSMEGTPVILSREGSMIRIVDEETGEIFFKKRPKSKDYGGRVPVFVPRQSILHFDVESDGNCLSTKLGKLLEVSACPVQAPEDEHAFPEKNSRDLEVPSAPPEESLGTKVSSKDRHKRGILLTSSTLRSTDEGSKNQKKEQSSRESKSRSKDKKAGVSSDIEAAFKSKESESGSTKTSSKSKSSKGLVTPLSTDNNNAELKRTSKTKSSSKSKSPEDSVTKKSSRRNKSCETSSGNPFLDASPSRKSRSRSDKRIGHERATLIPEEIFENIFSYLNSKDLDSASRVCRRWKKLTDPDLRGPILLKGKSFYGHYYSSGNCKKFVTFLQQFEAKFYRPYEIQFREVQNFQISTLGKRFGHEFRSAVRHMVALQLENSQLKWKTFILLLQSFVNLRSLTDTNSHHYSGSNPWGSCLKNRHNWKKEMKRQEFIEFKGQLKRLKTIKISRLTIDQELVILMNILTQGARNVEEFELSLGPWETYSKSKEAELANSLTPFVKALNLFMFKNCKSLKIVTFKCSDKNYVGYFQKCLDALEKLQLSKLVEISFQFDKNALKNPRNLMRLRQFLEYHCSKALRKVTISKLPLGECWYQTAMFCDELMTQNLFATVFNFEIVLSDCFGLQTAATTMRIFQFQIFKQFTTHVHVSIESDKTKSVAQLLGMQENEQYPRVNSVLVTFDPNSARTYPAFGDFCVDIIVYNFPNMTQLRMSDRPVAHKQIFNRVSGKSLLPGVSKASLNNADIQLICAVLVNLKVLKLWVDLTRIDDHGITGIHLADILILREDDVNYTWRNFRYDLASNFSNLKGLEELSLRGLGNGVTNISAKFGFDKMELLNVLEIFGDLRISWKGRRGLRRKLKENGTILRIRNCRV